MTVPGPRPGILDIQPYRGGNADIGDLSQVINVSANESALGASPRAVQAFEACAAELHRYPDGGAIGLRHGNIGKKRYKMMINLLYLKIIFNMDCFLRLIMKYTLLNIRSSLTKDCYVKILYVLYHMTTQAIGYAALKT